MRFISLACDENSFEVTESNGKSILQYTFLVKGATCYWEVRGSKSPPFLPPSTLLSHFRAEFISTGSDISRDEFSFSFHATTERGILELC